MGNCNCGEEDLEYQNEFYSPKQEMNQTGVTNLNGTVNPWARDENLDGKLE